MYQSGTHIIDNQGVGIYFSMSETYVQTNEAKLSFFRRLTNPVSSGQTGYQKVLIGHF